MEIAKIVLEYLKALAWPVITVVLAVTFKSDVKQLLRRLRGVRAGGAELDFEERAREERVAAQEEASETDQEAGAVSAREDSAPILLALAEVADASPEAAVLGAWRVLEQKILFAAYAALGWDPDRPPPRRYTARMLIDELSRAGLDQRAVRSMLRMSDLRNRAAHEEGTVTPEGAQEFAIACDGWIHVLDGFMTGIHLSADLDGESHDLPGERS
ncbi:hypothetical protein OG588_33910 [Streptomyces prunicolor]|uniref:hypothetical protein n=1 Tax=Streptomyces prunicolor TaxID=67348 RepID=UPI0038633329|nr:hypothetical protein OG588_33910 [Streptomyces prunicolor]